MKKARKAMRKLREMEEKLTYATPEQAAKLTGKIVKLKASVFDKIER